MDKTICILDFDYASLLVDSWFLDLHKIAGFLPVVAGGVWDKWLIISGFLGKLPVNAIAGFVATFFV